MPSFEGIVSSAANPGATLLYDGIANRHAAVDRVFLRAPRIVVHAYCHTDLLRFFLRSTTFPK